MSVHSEVALLLEKNQRTCEGHYYTVPSPETYPYQWLWDSCWHSIMLSHIDVTRAKAELRSLLSKQHPSGLLGHITYWQPPEKILKINWGMTETSSLVQPPLLAYAAWRIYEKDKDHSFLEEIFPACAAFYQYLIRERDVRNVGLVGLVNPDESGEDNSPRFDEALQLPPQHSADVNTKKRYHLFERHKDCSYQASCTSTDFWVEDVPFNSFLHMNLRVMADIAHVLKQPKAYALYKNQARSLHQAMRTNMFHDGVFSSLTGLAGSPIQIPTTALFIPLLTGQYSHQEAYHLITTQLLNADTFWLPAGIPSVSKQDPSFDPTEPTWGNAWQRPHWRGPVWMTMHWCIYHGLKRYGFTTKAAELKAKSEALIAKQGFREYFNPITGTGMGAENFTWGGLIIDMN